MATTAKVDTKAGFCQWCRQGDHGICASTTCTCTQVVHRSRPGFGRAAQASTPARNSARNGGGSASPHSAARTAHAAPKGDDDSPPPLDVHRRATGAASRPEPVWELVKADPPAKPEKPKRVGTVERARPFLELILEAESRDWHRIALFPTAMGAAQTVGRLRKAYSRTEWEWKAAKVAEVGQSAVYVRWLGTAKELL